MGLISRVSSRTYRELKTKMDFTSKLDNESLENLEQLPNDFEKMSSLIQDDPTIKGLKQQKSDLINQTKNLAESNLAQKPILENAMAQLTSMQSEFEILKASLQEEQSLQLENVKERLENAENEAQFECNNLADKFQDDELSVNEFIKKFLKEKSDYHTRKAKKEEICSMINDRDIRAKDDNGYRSSPSQGRKTPSRKAPAVPSGQPTQGYAAYGAYPGYPSLT